MIPRRFHVRRGRGRIEVQANFYFGIVRRKADTAAHSFSSGRLTLPPNVLILFFMSQDDGMGEIVTLDALDALREECVKLGNAIHASSDRIFRIQQELSNPNVFSLPTRLPFQIEHWDDHGNDLRWVISASSNVTIARAAFDAAIKYYPNYRWTLSQGMMRLGEHKPKPEVK